MSRDDKKKNRKESTLETIIYLAGYVIDGIVQLILFIPRVAIRFISGFLS